MNLATMRARVRTDLRDEGTPQLWTDGELDRHITRAVDEASLAVPRELTASLLSAGGRVLDVSALAPVIRIEAVEYPLDEDPAAYQMFSQWAQQLTLLGEPIPKPGDAVRIYYLGRHTLDELISTLPVELEDIVATGAAAYAALAWAAHAANRLTVGGEDVWRHYQTLGAERLAAFSAELARRSRRASLRERRMYRPANPAPLSQTELGPL